MPSSSADDDARAILDSIRRLVQALREGGRAAERAVGLSGAQLFVLEQLASARALSLNELAARTLTHQSSASVVVRKLARKGLLERRAAASDRRRIELAITAAGRRALSKAPATAQELLLDGVRRLGPSARRGLARSLATLVARLPREAGPPPMFFEE